MKLTYVIQFVGNMERAVAFYRDTLGLPLIFSSPGWSEFATGETKLGLHPASQENPSGTVQLGFSVPDLDKSYQEMTSGGIAFPMPPTKQDYGGMLAQFVDSEGGRSSLSGEPA